MIGYSTFGRGPARAIVLHGWFGDETSLEGIYPALDPEQLTLACMAYRGYGASRDMKGQFTLDEIGRDALDLADHLGWDRFHAVGHSMGGMAVQWLAAHATTRIISGIAITPVPAGGFPMDDGSWALFAGAADSADNRAAIINFTTGQRHNAAWLATMVAKSLSNSTREAFAAYLLAWAKTDFSERARGIMTPLKVLVGEHDLAVTPDFMRATILAWFPRAEMEVIPNAGHYPMNETPVSLADAMQAYMYLKGM